MGILEEYKKRKIIQRLSEEQLYALIHEEIEEGIIRQGLWAKAVAENCGDSNNAMVHYIKLRLQSLQDEFNLISNVPEDKSSDGVMRRVGVDNQADERELPLGSGCVVAIWVFVAVVAMIVFLVVAKL